MGLIHLFFRVHGYSTMAVSAVSFPFFQPRGEPFCAHRDLCEFYRPAFIVSPLGPSFVSVLILLRFMRYRRLLPVVAGLAMLLSGLGLGFVFPSLACRGLCLDALLSCSWFVLFCVQGFKLALSAPHGVFTLVIWQGRCPQLLAQLVLSQFFVFVPVVFLGHWNLLCHYTGSHSGKAVLSFRVRRCRYARGGLNFLKGSKHAAITVGWTRCGTSS